MATEHHYVLRQVHPPGLSADAREATMLALATAVMKAEVIEGKYLEWHDVDAHGGRGADRWTSDVSKALRFNSFQDAMACWKQQSKKVPLRDDGKPNRPLTAYSVMVEKVKD